MATNREVGDRIGLSHSSVSRIRAGERIPSIDVMQVIAREYGWSLDDQATARADQVKYPANRAYVLGFERAVDAEDAEAPEPHPIDVPTS